jgi:hypothetical protein
MELGVAGISSPSETAAAVEQRPHERTPHERTLRCTRRNDKQVLNSLVPTLEIQYIGDMTFSFPIADWHLACASKHCQ